MPRHIFEEESSWPEYGYQVSVGSYGGLDDRYKLRRRKQPLGFVQQPPRPKAATRRRTK